VQPDVARTIDLETWRQWLPLFEAGGLQFTSPGKKEEEIPATFAGYIQAAYRTSGPIFACMLARASLFSEARFQWRRMQSGRPGELFGTEELAVLEEPWPNGTTGDLLVRLIQDYDLAGNFYGRRTASGVERMRPDWTTIVLGSQMEVDNPSAALDAEVVGYVYHPGGRNSGADPVPLRVDEVCHFTGPTPDPQARFRGMSWLTPILREISADSAATSHKLRFFEAGGPNQAIIVDIPDPDEFQEYVTAFSEAQARQPYKRLFFNAGTEIKTVGADLVQMDFKVTQGAGESRIAAAAGVPPVIVGFSEGLEAATYSNYALAMRRFADLTMRPLWRMAAACFQSVLTVPGGAELWYDDRDIAALKDDIVSRAEVQVKQATAAKAAFDAGYLPDSIVEWLNSDDITRLNHSGLSSVQNQPGALPPAEPQPALPPAARSLVDELEEVLGGETA
jgi:phage portal protein BeeE